MPRFRAILTVWLIFESQPIGIEVFSKTSGSGRYFRAVWIEGKATPHVKLKVSDFVPGIHHVFQERRDILDMRLLEKPEAARDLKWDAVPG